jgi:hypothetical protein
MNDSDKLAKLAGIPVKYLDEPMTVRSLHGEARETTLRALLIDGDVVIKEDMGRPALFLNGGSRLVFSNREV